MVKEVAQRIPVLIAITVCIDVTGKPVANEKGKPKKVGPPKVNINFESP